MRLSFLNSQTRLGRTVASQKCAAIADIDRIQCQLIGRRFQRPVYGQGCSLEMLQEVVKKFAL